MQENLFDRFVWNVNLRDALGNIFKISPTFWSPILRYAISRQFREVTNVAKMQAIIRDYMDKMIQLQFDLLAY